jgi:hypothetical protein
MNKVMTALLAGFAAGILPAPDKSSVTRKKINDNFDDLPGKPSDLKDKYLPAEKEIAGNVVAKMGAAV